MKTLLADDLMYCWMMNESQASQSVAIPSNVTLFHITHWKAGSQWMRVILEDVFRPAIVPAEYFEAQLLQRPIETGKVYLCAYVGQQEFKTISLPGEHRRFVLIRDLRDTLISVYFSARNSHEIQKSIMEKWRRVLIKLDQEEGMLYLLDAWLNLCGLIQRS
ncbi:MAG: hypothetical protein ACREVH_11440 [Gammaproteobacteria bacterium]